MCWADNVEMTDRSIQGGFSAVCLPRAINRSGRPKERERRRKRGRREWLGRKEDQGQGLGSTENGPMSKEEIEILLSILPKTSNQMNHIILHLIYR